MDIQLSRQARRGGGGGSRAAERPLPFDVGAGSVRDDLRSVLVGWVRDLVESHGAVMPADSLAAMAGVLCAHDWRKHPAVDEFADELGWALRSARAAIDLPQDRVYLGTCMAAPGARGGQGDAEGVEVGPSANPGNRGAQGADTGVCVAELWARHGAASVTCRGCGAAHDVDERKAALLGMCHDRLAHAELIARALSTLATPVSGSTIRQWAHRGRIVAKGRDIAGRPLYSVGECLALSGMRAD